jgi:hypothetical protein
LRPFVLTGARLVLFAGIVASVAGCATAPRPPAAPRLALAQPPPVLPPWEIPPSALGTQRLYRMSLAGPAGEGTLRVTLRLESLRTYQVEAVDPIGRTVWTLGVADGKALMIDHRGRVACPTDDRVEVPGLPLGSFSLATLPLLLTGRLPAATPVVPSGTPHGSDLEVTDHLGRKWTVTTAGGELTGWTLWNDAQPAAWWRRQDDGQSLLSVKGAEKDQGRGVQLRWREVLSEKLTGPLKAVTLPTGFRELPTCEPLTTPR